MKHFIKTFFKGLLLKNGYEINSFKGHSILQPNPFEAIITEISFKNPIFFDIGMNHGQTLKQMKLHFPTCIIHGFEPNAQCFKSLEDVYNDSSIILNQKAVGAEEGVLRFNQYSWDALSSVLERVFTTSHIVDSYDVDVTSVDAYCKTHKISHIHVLKTDTEGYELRVLEGARHMLERQKIQFVYVELFFESHFVDQSTAGDIINFLLQHHFKLIRFYEFERSKAGFVSRTDALFVNPNFKP